jgi:Na+/serine symporter
MIGMLLGFILAIIQPKSEHAVGLIFCGAFEAIAELVILAKWLL